MHAKLGLKLEVPEFNRLKEVGRKTSVSAVLGKRIKEFVEGEYKLTPVEVKGKVQTSILIDEKVLQQFRDLAASNTVPMEEAIRQVVATLVRGPDL